MTRWIIPGKFDTCFKALLVAWLFCSASVTTGDSWPPDDSAAVCGNQLMYFCRAGSGEVSLVFVHGWGGRAAFWKHQLEHFAGEYSVFAVELPGHGRSSGTDVKPTVDGLAAELGSLLERLDLRDVILVGHDMGAYIALSATATRKGRKRISHLVAVESLVDTLITLPGKQYEGVIESLHEDFPATARQLVSDLFEESSDPATVDWVSGAVAATDPDFAMPFLEDFLQIDLSNELADFKGRLVILNTEYNPPELENLGRLSRGVRSLEAPWEEHFAFLERPDLFNQMLERALELALDEDP